MNDPTLARVKALADMPSTYSGFIDEIELVRDKEGELWLPLADAGIGRVVALDEWKMVLEWTGDANTFMPPHWHSFSEYLEVYEGGLQLDVAGEGGTIDKFSLGPGCKCSIEPYRAHAAYYPEKTLVKIIWTPCPEFVVREEDE